MNVLQSLNGALRQCLAEDQHVYFLGEDVLDPYGGAFKVARGLSTEFPDRVISTPVSEAGIVGLGTGMALRGLRPVVEIMFGDFLLLAADQLVNHAAKLRWMANDQIRVPLVVRTPMGGRRGYGPTHSQSLEKHLLGAPGLTVAAVSAIDDPGGILRYAVLEDQDPVLLVEHKLLYAQEVLSLDGSGELTVERIGQGYPTYRLRVAGAPPPTLTLATYGYMAELARQAVLRLAYEHELFAELVVFTRLSPPDVSPLMEGLDKTRSLVTIEEGTLSLGWGAEIAARSVEALGRGLSLRRVAAREMPVPAAGPLEEAVLPQIEDLMAAAVELAGRR
jgi:pyruvate/2-oxoglutarate/acetoin dehydrogenase E1 component